MTNILQKFLQKCGVKEFSELNAEEKDTYRKWEEVLAGRKLTDEDVAQFLFAEFNDALGKLKPDLDMRTDCFLKLKIEFIRKVGAFLRVPELEKKVLEANLNQP